MYMLSKKVDKIKEDIKYLKNIDGIYGKVSRVANTYDYVYSKFWKCLSQLENDIKKIKEEEEMLIKRHNRKQTKFMYDYVGYTINTTPKL